MAGCPRAFATASPPAESGGEPVTVVSVTNNFDGNYELTFSAPINTRPTEPSDFEFFDGLSWTPAAALGTHAGASITIEHGDNAQIEWRIQAQPAGLTFPDGRLLTTPATGEIPP